LEVSIAMAEHVKLLFAGESLRRSLYRVEAPGSGEFLDFHIW
jgi:hypothetical protein